MFNNGEFKTFTLGGGGDEPDFFSTQFFDIISCHRYQNVDTSPFFWKFHN